MNTPTTHMSLLLAMQQNGSVKQDAWAGFMMKYRHVIIAWCLKNGVPNRLAEDFSQEIMMAILEKLPSYQPEKGRFRSWLSTVVHHYIVSRYHRKRRPDDAPLGGDVSQQVLEQLQAPPLIEALAESVDSFADPILSAAIDAARQRVNPETWAIFEQTVLQERAVADVAAELNISKGKAHMAKSRFLLLLRDEYLNRQHAEGFPAEDVPRGTATQSLE